MSSLGVLLLGCTSIDTSTDNIAGNNYESYIEDHYRRVEVKTPERKKECEAVNTPIVSEKPPRTESDIQSQASSDNIVGFKEVENCTYTTTYKTEVKEVYSYSEISFWYNGRYQKIRFKK